jgi:hypothetical protein
MVEELQAPAISGLGLQARTKSSTLLSAGVGACSGSHPPQIRELDITKVPHFRYENTLPQKGDWTGTIETEWLDFEVTKPSVATKQK